MGIPEACISERSRVPEELFCQVCMDLVSKPVQTATHHIFCHDCLSRALAVQAVCPVTRNPLQNNATDVKPLDVANPIMHRVWSKVVLRCPNALGGICTWHGGPTDLDQHFQCCPAGQVDAVAELRRELAAVRKAAGEVETQLKTKINRLKEELRTERQRRTAFDATYSYGRERIVELALVILRDLENVPKDIDTSVVAYVWFNPAFATDDDKDPEIDILRYLKADLPPAIAFFGDKDPWKKGWDTAHAKWKALGTKTIDLQIAPGQSHSFFNNGPWQTVTLIAADQFLVKQGLLSGEPLKTMPASGEKLVPTP